MNSWWILPSVEDRPLLLHRRARGNREPRRFAYSWSREGAAAAAVAAADAVGGRSIRAAAVTGYVLLRINPANSLGPPVNVAFAAKILFLAMIGLNDILFFATGLKRQVDGVGAGEDTSPSAKIVAGVSLALWTGVVFWSRMLTLLAGAI